MLLRLAALLTLFLFVVIAPFPDDPSAVGWHAVSDALRGVPHMNEFAQDLIGAWALLDGSSAYPILGEAFPAYGMADFRPDHTTTHPPTAFLLVLPLTLFENWYQAVQVWAWLGLVFLAVGIWALDVRWDIAVCVAILCLWWQPAALALSVQLTAPMFTGAALAYRWRERLPYAAGAALALATFLKLSPALFAIAFLVRRQWRALLSFIAACGIGVLAVLALNASTVVEYITVQPASALAITTRPDNASPLHNLLRTGGVPAMVGFLCLLVYLIANAWKTRRDERLWAALSIASLVLLPIAWMYSLVPLLFVMVVLWRHHIGRWCVAATLLVSGFAPQFGEAPRLIPTLVCAILMAGMLATRPKTADALPQKAQEPAQAIQASGD